MVITAVVGKFLSDNCINAFWTAIAATPNMPAMIASILPPSNAKIRKMNKKEHCNDSNGIKVLRFFFSKKWTKSLGLPWT